jgi:hypothetical protein
MGAKLKQSFYMTKQNMKKIVIYICFFCSHQRYTLKYSW